MAENAKDLRNLKSIDEFKWDQIEVIRGDTPHDIKQQCLQLCKDYLANNWTQQTVDNIEIRRLTGGACNQMYYCGITDGLVTGDTPQEVMIRFYGPKYFNKPEDGSNERLTDVIIALMVSENKLGPKVYGLFEAGQILGYYKHRQFRLAEQANPKLVDQAFKKLAAVHAMKVPIKKDTKWIFNDFEQFYDEAYQKWPINQMFDDLNLNTFKTHDLKLEFEWLKSVVGKCQSPVVFSHNDFRGSNIMITEPNDEIILCDLEYSGYNHRGFDFGTLMAEWGRDFSEFMKSEKLIQKYPNDETIKSLIEIYLTESERLLGKGFKENPMNSIEHILNEVKVFTLVATMYIVMISFKNDETDGGFPLAKNILMTSADGNYESYLYLKQKFIEQNIFD